jgi:hypothetical protein
MPGPPAFGTAVVKKRRVIARCETFDFSCFNAGNTAKDMAENNFLAASWWEGALARD